MESSQRQFVAVPARQGGVGLHRIVVQRRRGVGVVDEVRGGAEGLVDIPLLGVGREAGIDLVGLVQGRVVLRQLDVVGLDVVLDLEPLGCLPRDLQRLRDDGRDELAAIGDGATLQHGEFAVFGGLQVGRVVRREDGEHLRHGSDRRVVDPSDRALGDCRRHRPDVGHVLDIVLFGGVLRLAGHLGRSFDPAEARADGPDVGLGHEPDSVREHTAGAQRTESGGVMTLMRSLRPGH